ncbi:MAG: S9 family peptidase [archaeon]|nr:MAG: S9 family peptidase [archaeon]
MTLRLKRDEYAWMEDLTDPRVASWARSQDKVARASVRKDSAVLYKRMREYYKLPIARSIEATKDGYVFFYSDERSYKVVLIRRDGSRTKLADSAGMGKDTVIQGLQARGEGGVYALHTSVGGSDEGVVDFIDYKAEEKLDSLRGHIGSVVWLKGSAIYYVRSYRKGKTPDGVKPPADRVFLRKNGREEMVFGKGLKTDTFIGLKKSGDGTRALVDLAFGWTRSTPVAGRVGEPDHWAPLLEKNASIVTHIGYKGGKHYLLSFRESNGSVVTATSGSARSVVAEGKAPLQDATLVGDELLCTYLEDASIRMRLFNLDGRAGKKLEFETPGSLAAFGTPSSYGSEAVFVFTSFALPYRIYRLSKGRMDVIASEELKGRFKVENRSAKSKDGTRVHYFMATKDRRPTKGVLLFGYGGFRVSLMPTFNPSYIPLLEDGIAYGVANLRGGLEDGEGWHKAGMREKKHHVFEDYIAVLESLKQRGDRVVGFGRSNGGLLMGTTMNWRPDLFAGVIIGYPVLDMLAFHRLLAGKAWVPEYGDPDDPKDARFLASYSPYQNLDEKKHYPPVFIYTGLKDDRVHPGHAFKFQARLKDMGVDSTMRVEVQSGHIGTTPEARIREEADKLAFAYKALGIRASKKAVSR